MKGLLIGVALFFTMSSSFAHYLWVETTEIGEIGKRHAVRVLYGEYTYGEIEEPNGENFQKVSDFTLKVVSPSGKEETLKTNKEGNAYQAFFVPKEKGVYTVVLNNDKIDVIDYTQYDFGIFKTHYHSTAKVSVGDEYNNTSSANNSGLSIVNTSKNEAEKGKKVELQVTYKGEPIAKQEVVIYVSDLWSKKLFTDENGMISFDLPWETKYTVETTKKENVPGTFRDEQYEFIWHCATTSIIL